MDVSGTIIADTKKILTLYCLPCDRDGLKVSAYGYCQDCKEHLCKTCFENHKRPKPCRNHILLDKVAMPTQQTDVNKSEDKYSENCSKHTDKPLEFHCSKHQTVACYVCVTLEHKQCKVDYIPELSGNVSDELIKLNKKMELLVKKCENNIMKAAVAAKQLEQSQGKFVEEIRLFRKELNDRLDQMESMMIKEAEDVVNTANCKLENIKCACEKIAEEVKRSQSFLKALKEANKHTNLFIELKNVKPRLMTLESEEMQIVKDNMTYDDIQFDRNEKLLDQLKSEKNFGKISTYKHPSEDTEIFVKYERSLNVNFSSDKSQSNVVGMVMVSATQMIIADYSYRKIKTIDVNTGKLVSEKTMSSAPRDVIKLPQNKLAVALPDENCIQIMSYTDTSLSLDDRRINVGEPCCCVAYSQNKLVVGCSSWKLIIMGLDGRVMKVFDGYGSLAGPQKIVISNDENFIYVSDTNFQIHSSCIKIDWQGNFVHTFEGLGYLDPIGIQELEDGTLLVCFFNRDLIARLSNSFKECEITGFERVNICYPRAIAYSERNHKLYVSCSSEKGRKLNDTIRIFNMK